MALDEELDLPRPFGPYTLVRRLAVGGMAEVYVAKTAGFGGFEKLVAIKVIHPRYSEDDHFVQMLVEEAKISVLLNHVNIAQTFDLGCIDDTYYIVMELIEGADAYRVMRKASEIKRALPLDVAAFIAAEVCNGLDYAHRKRDPNGNPLGIVHRDVSPQNVLISYAGEVKVVDFGIAKAALRSGQTEAGVIKGKYYYMSPEQAWGDPMDHRSDIFSTGVVLYELLTGRMLYTEENVPLLLDKVRKAEIQPPEQRRPSIPQALSAIVMKALAKDPAHRFQSAGEMTQALTQFVYSASPAFTAGRLAEMMGTLFPNEVQRHSAIVKLPSVEEPLDRPPSERPLAKQQLAHSAIFDEDEEDMTRNDVLPFRKKAAAAARVTKPAAELAAEGPRPTFRPPRMKIADDPEETTAPGRKDPAPTDRITAPAIGAPAIGKDGAWVSPLPVEAVTTNPARATEDVTDDTQSAAEWDDPTKLKDEDWEADQTLVDTEGLAQAIDALRGGSPGAVKSERGKVNVQMAPGARPAARLGKSDVRPLAPAAAKLREGVAPARPPSVPPPPAASAWERAQAKKIPSVPKLPAAPPGAMPPGAMPPGAMPPGAMPPPSAPRPPAQAIAAPVSSGSTSVPPHSSGARPVPPSSSGAQAIASSGAQPIATSGTQPIASSGAFVTPPHLSAPHPSAPPQPGFSSPVPKTLPMAPAPVLDPFAPPPPSVGITGGFAPAEAGGSSRRTVAIVSAAVVLAAIAIGAIAMFATGGPPPTLDIVSAPTGAQVAVGGRVVGTAPVTITEGLEVGRPVHVDVTMAGFQPWSADLTPEAGTTRQFVVLAPMRATLHVETDPPGAQVTVNGVLRGPAPVDVADGLTVGQDVAITATIPGRPPVVRQVRLGEGTTTERILIATP